jgi:hypothetical protein
MFTHKQVAVATAFVLSLARMADAEILVRWDRDDIPAQQSLDIETIVVPAANAAAVRNAVSRGYRVFLEVDGSTLATFVPPAHPLAGIVVTGKASAVELNRLKQRLASRGGRVFALEQGKWPHIRTNWVTSNKGVLQVTRASQQPWIENNRASIRIMANGEGSARALTYTWQPITLSDKDEGPRLENYLVAIAEAGSFGADLVLPLHQNFEERLLLGQPQARAEWEQICRYVRFYSWNLPVRYQPVANIGVVTADPVLWFEVMNLLGRHNLAFMIIDPAGLTTIPSELKMLIVLDQLPPARLAAVAEFAQKGGTLVLGGLKGASASNAPWHSAEPVNRSPERASYRVGEGRVVEFLKPIADPNMFALEMRQLLGREQRAIEIWNGITFLAAPYREPGGTGLLVTAVNYAADPQPIQVRIPGTFSSVQYESPEEPAALLPHQNRDGYTEFVLPGLRVGGRVFLTRSLD